MDFSKRLKKLKENNMKRISGFIVLFLFICLFFTGCKTNDENALIDSNDQLVNEEDKIIIDEIVGQDFSKFEHISMFGAENETALLLTYDEKEKNDILSILKLNEKKFLYKHCSTKDDNPFNYLYYCMHIDFENIMPRMDNPSTNFYVSKDGRVFILFLSDDSYEFHFYYTDKNVVNHQELHDYYDEWYTNWLINYQSK